MNRKPRIPMQPAELPQQRLYLVKGAPLRPPGWSATIVEPADRDVPLMPRSARYLGQAEWAWSPMHMRIDAYYLSMDGSHRRSLLWVKHYDDNWGRWEAPSIVAHGPRTKLGATDAARLLLLDYWAVQRGDGTDRFHWINEEGLLGTEDLNAIATFVWNDETERDTEDDGPRGVSPPAAGSSLTP